MKNRQSEFGLGLLVDVTKIFRWEGAHQLVDSVEEGCQNIHGHSYKMEVTLTAEGDKLNDMGMVIDFKVISKVVDPIVKKFDHQFITFDTFAMNPTAENMAILVMEEVSAGVRKAIANDQMTKGTYCSKIRIWETDKCHVTVRFPKESFSNVCC